MPEITITDVSRSGGNVVLVTADGTVTRTIVLPDAITSIIPANMKKIVNMYYNPTTNKIIVVYEA